MCKPLMTLVAVSLLLAAFAPAQAPDALTRWREHMDRVMGPWGEATVEKLVRFLPDASPWSFSTGRFTDPIYADACKFKKGLDNCGFYIWNVHVKDKEWKYPALDTAQTWWFDDAVLSQQLEDVRKQKETFKQESEALITEFERVHGGDRKAAEKVWEAETEALKKQLAELVRQGKYAEVQAVADKMKPFRYEPQDSLFASLDKKQHDLDKRERDLGNRRRSVQFEIVTNRTPSATVSTIGPFCCFAHKQIGTIAGHTLYRDDRSTTQAMRGGGRLRCSGPGSTSPCLLYLAVLVGPPVFQNPLVDDDKTEPTVKCVVVLANIESRPDTLQTDEAAVRKVLEKVDYDGLAKLIEP